MIDLGNDLGNVAWAPGCRHETRGRRAAPGRGHLRTPRTPWAQWATPLISFGEGERSQRDDEDPSTAAQTLRGWAQALRFFVESLAADEETVHAAGVGDLVETLHGQALWLELRLENVLAAAAIRQGALRLRRQAVDLAALFAELRPVLKPLLAQRRQRLRLRRAPVDRPPGLALMGGAARPAASGATVLGDPRRLAQVLMNLVGHAGATSPAGGIVDVRLEMVQRHDNYTGGEEGALYAEQIRVTLRSARAPVAAAALGLAVARAIVRAHGGRLQAEPASGGSSLVWFELPCLSDGNTPDQPASPLR